MSALPNSLLPSDPDAQETQEWLDALEAVIEQEGPERAHFLIERLVELARRTGINLPYKATTAYINTIPPGQEDALARQPRAGAPHPLLRALERAGDGAARQQGRFEPRRSYRQLRFRCHALRRRLQPLLAFAFRESRRRHGVRAGPFGSRVYARAFMLGRLTEDQMNNFRREVDGKGLSSYPHRG